MCWRILLSVDNIERERDVRGGELLSAGLGQGGCLRRRLLLRDSRTVSRDGVPGGALLRGGVCEAESLSSRQLLPGRGECTVGVRCGQLLSGGVEPELSVCGRALLRERHHAGGVRGKLILSCRLDG